MLNLEVNISGKNTSYPITIEQDKIENLRVKILKTLRGQKFLVVISQKVDSIYGKALGFSKEEKFILKDGEIQKNFNNYKKIIDHALKICRINIYAGHRLYSNTHNPACLCR